MKTQPEKLAKLLTRPQGTTAMEICRVVGTVSPHKRMSELKERGWAFTKKKVPGHPYHRYWATAPFHKEKS